MDMNRERGRQSPWRKKGGRNLSFESANSGSEPRRDPNYTITMMAGSQLVGTTAFVTDPADRLISLTHKDSTRPIFRRAIKIIRTSNTA
jgi:hypothetical protein